MIDAPEVIAQLAAARGRRTGSTVVGIAGAVAAGKTTLAAKLARVLADAGSTVEVVGTDGFLYPNAVLMQRDIFMRKGFPESYDVAALQAFVDAIRAGTDSVVVPVYSHETYDIVPERERIISRADVVVVEGVNALSALPDRLDLGVYLHAEDADLETWYVVRFHELCASADEASFYRRFAGVSFGDRDAIARQVWREVNLVNLRDHIAPSRALAHCVVMKGPDHVVNAVDLRDDGDTPEGSRPVPTDHDDRDLVALLDQVWHTMGALGAELSEHDWKTPTEVPGWTVQDNLAHIAGIEWMLLGRPAPDHAVPDDLPHVKNPVGEANEVFVDARRDRAGSEVLAEFREVTEARLEQLRAFAPEDFACESWTPVGPGTVRDLLPFRMFDSWVHEQDMRRAVDRPGDLDSPVAAVSLDRIVAAVPFVVGKKAGAPDGSTVVFELTGPLARTFAVGVDGGRAKPLDAVPPNPTVRVVTDTETFARLGCGRIDPIDALRDETVRLEGDEALGRTVVAQLNFLF